MNEPRFSRWKSSFSLLLVAGVISMVVIYIQQGPSTGTHGLQSSHAAGDDGGRDQLNASLQNQIGSETQGSGASRSQNASEPPSSHRSSPRTYFKQLTEQTLQTLPTLADLKNLTEAEAHGSPRAILEGARKLGVIAEAIEQNPELVQDGMAFYSQCSQSDSYPPAIRASCYASLKRLNPSAFHDGKEDPQVPASIQDIANKIF